VFTLETDREHASESAKEREFFAEIGRLKMELEWLKTSWRARALRSAAA
jgi:hypothetical protein